MLKLGIIGCGSWGSNLLRNLADLENTHLKWICDADPLKLSAAKKQYPGVKGTTVFTDILEDPEVDGVLVATPPISHATMAKQVLLADKHVFVEKPLALSSEDAYALVKLADRKKRILMVGHLLRYHPAVIKLKEIIDSGELGEVFYIYSQRLNLGTIRRHENALWNLGCHDISVMLYLLGEDPLAVSAVGNPYVQEEVEDTVFVNLQFANKKMAHIHVSWLDPHKVRRITVVGSKRMAVFDDMEKERKIIVYDKGFVSPEHDSVDTPIEIREGRRQYPKVHHQQPLHLEVQHFAECIRKNKKPRTDGVEGLKVVEILSAAQKSLSGRGNAENLDFSRLKKFIHETELAETEK
jgi:predicted dehydrogenase